MFVFVRVFFLLFSVSSVYVCVCARARVLFLLFFCFLKTCIIIFTTSWLIFSDWGVRPRIERTDLLGHKRQILVDSDILQPRGMTIDMASLHLYWVDSAKGTVESVSLRGEDLHRSVVRKKDGAYYVGIACFKVSCETDGILTQADGNLTQTDGNLTQTDGILTQTDGICPRLMGF